MAALAATWFWVLAPLAGFEVFGFSGTDADLVRRLHHFRLVQPEWVSNPPDYMRWSQAETLARLIVVFLGWLVGVILIVRRYLKSHRHTPPNTALEPTATDA